MTKKIALLAALAATVAAIWYAGVFDAFRETERVKALLLGWGAWGWVLYVVCFALIEPLGVPGILFVVPAGMIWPKSVAFGLSLLASLLASSLGFGFRVSWRATGSSGVSRCASGASTICWSGAVWKP